MANNGEKVYISGALMGSSNLETAQVRYENFGQMIEQIGYTAYIPHQNTSPNENAGLSDDHVYQKDIENLESSEILFVYIGEPSLGVGAEIAIAIKSKKKIIAVFEEDKKVSRFITGYIRSYKNSNIIQYQNYEDLEQRLIELIGQTDVIFQN